MDSTAGLTLCGNWLIRVIACLGFPILLYSDLSRCPPSETLLMAPSIPISVTTSVVWVTGLYTSGLAPAKSIIHKVPKGHKKRKCTLFKCFEAPTTFRTDPRSTAYGMWSPLWFNVCYLSTDMHYFTHQGSFLTSTGIIVFFPKATAHNPFNIPFFGLRLNSHAWKLRSVLFSASSGQSSFSFGFLECLVYHIDPHTYHVLLKYSVNMTDSFRTQLCHTGWGYYLCHLHIPSTHHNTRYICGWHPKYAVELSCWNKHWAQVHSLLKT